MTFLNAQRRAFFGLIVAVGVLLLLDASGTACTQAAAVHVRPLPAPAVPERAVAPTAGVVASSCPTAAPATAAGYAAMFHALPTTIWGAADVSISVKVGARVVWLFGDTISNVTSWSPYAGRFVHSTAVTQDRGCLHVSHSGLQLLPNDSDGSWYWIKAAAAVDGSHLRITADHVQATGTGAWDFKVIGERTATATLASNGDVTFQSWTGAPVPVQHIVQKDGGIYAPWTSTVSEITTGQVLVTGLPHTTSNFSYAPSVHQEVTLASGKTLLTVCQNSSPLTSYDGYRPLWYEVTL